MADRKQIVLFGPGALGLYFASRLAVAGAADITIVARSDYEAFRQTGKCHVSSRIHGEYDFEPAHVIRPGEPLPVKPDYVLVCFKATGGFDQTAVCGYAIGPDTTVLVIENGLAPEAQFTEKFPDADINTAVAFLGASRPAPASVKHFDSGKLAMGPAVCGREPSAKLLALAALFESAGVSAEVTDNMPRKRWNKLLWNAPFNPLCVLANDADSQQIMNCAEMSELAWKMMLELCEIAQADGVDLPVDDAEYMMEYTRNFAAYKPSMLQDFTAGRPLELEAILGDPIRRADAHGIAAPCLRAVYALMKLASRPGHPRPAAERTD